MSLNPAQITACLVTRGDVDMRPILDTLPYGEVLIYDNSKEHVDLKVYGRYEVVKRASNDVIYWQDDDVIFTEHKALLAAYEPGTFVSNNAHGPNTGGYDDLALQAAGALCPKLLVEETWSRWWGGWPIRTKLDFISTARALQDDGVHMPVSGVAGFTYGILYEADFIFGVLCKHWKQIDLPYTRLYADDNSRLCRQPWQEHWKRHMTDLARGIRDGR
jgi:hypothetical protein